MEESSSDRERVEGTEGEEGKEARKQESEEGASSPFYIELGIPGFCQVTVGQKA